jgi:hypothetical protein
LGQRPAIGVLAKIAAAPAEVPAFVDVQLWLYLAPKLRLAAG